MCFKHIFIMIFGIRLLCLYLLSIPHCRPKEFQFSAFFIQEVLHRRNQVFMLEYLLNRHASGFLHRGQGADELIQANWHGFFDVELLKGNPKSSVIIKKFIFAFSGKTQIHNSGVTVVGEEQICCIDSLMGETVRMHVVKAQK